MPAKRKTKEDRTAEAFANLYRIGKARSGMKDSEVADALGIKSVMTWRKRRNRPEIIPLGDFAKLSVLLQWQDSEVDALVEMMK